MKTVGQIAAEWKEEEEAKKKLAEVTAERDRMRAALERQHRWHLNQTDRSPVYFGDTIGQVNAEEYAESELCEITEKALAMKAGPKRVITETA